MNFDMISMKQRAKALMKNAVPKPTVIGAFFAILVFAYYMLFFYVCESEKIWLLVITELVYLNFRNCCNFYAVKVSREEQTSFGDCFSAFHKKPFKILLLSIVREILYGVGLCVMIVGVVFPIYWFRFAGYILRDEDVGIFKALAKSKKMLKGHYNELIKLDISNLGWYALVYCTFGVAAFYVKPYTAIVYAEFYDYIKAQNEF